MTTMEKARMRLYEDAIRQLRETADDRGLTRDWKLVLMRGILNELSDKLARLDKLETGETVEEFIDRFMGEGDRK